MLRLLMLAIGICLPALAQSQSCSITSNENIIHLPQLHWGELLESRHQSPEYLDMVAKSQFELTHTLLENPDRAVFMESRFEDSTRTMYNRHSRGNNMVSRVKAIFPHGKIPKTFADLSWEQKQFLARTGGVETLYLLGKLKVIHKTYASKAQAEEFDKAIDEVLKTLKQNETPNASMVNAITKKREQAAVSEVAKWMKENPRKKVFIVYGAAHDFDPYYTKEFARATCPNSEMPAKWSVSLDKLKRIPATTN